MERLLANYEASLTYAIEHKEAHCIISALLPEGHSFRVRTVASCVEATVILCTSKEIRPGKHQARFTLKPGESVTIRIDNSVPDVAVAQIIFRLGTTNAGAPGCVKVIDQWCLDLKTISRLASVSSP